LLSKHQNNEFAVWLQSASIKQILLPRDFLAISMNNLVARGRCADDPSFLGGLETNLPQIVTNQSNNREAIMKPLNCVTRLQDVEFNNYRLSIPVLGSCLKYPLKGILASFVSH